jgi:hypothetical protein
MYRTVPALLLSLTTAFSFSQPAWQNQTSHSQAKTEASVAKKQTKENKTHQKAATAHAVKKSDSPQDAAYAAAYKAGLPKQ